MKCRANAVTIINFGWKTFCFGKCLKQTNCLYFFESFTFKVPFFPVVFSGNFPSPMNLTNFFPLLHFYPPWKHVEIVKFSYIFEEGRGVKKYEIRNKRMNLAGVNSQHLSENTLMEALLFRKVGDITTLLKMNSAKNVFLEIVWNFTEQFFYAVIVAGIVNE